MHCAPLRRWEGEEALRRIYKNFYKKDLNLEHLNTFTEKMFCRMITVVRKGNIDFTRVADKYLVRDYVRGKIGGQYLTTLIWEGRSPREIPFHRLPSRCVIKTNHGANQFILFNGSNDPKQIITLLDIWLKENYYWMLREYHYYDIPPRILIEEFLDDEEPHGPLDYRFWCFDGLPELIQIDNHAHSINPFYDTSWNKLDLRYREEVAECNIKKPNNLDSMLKVASALAKDWDFARVDLYRCNGDIFFGELTFTPCAGLIKFRPEAWDTILGQKWQMKG